MVYERLFPAFLKKYLPPEKLRKTTFGEDAVVTQGGLLVVHDFNFHEMVVIIILLLILFTCFHKINSNGNFKKKGNSGRLKKKKLKFFKVIQPVSCLQII